MSVVCRQVGRVGVFLRVFFGSEEQEMFTVKEALVLLSGYIERDRP